MSKITLKPQDLPRIHIRDEQESIEVFGAEFVEKHGIEMPDDLIKRYQETLETCRTIQAEIQDHINKAHKSTTPRQ